MTALDRWNALNADEAAAAVLPCCGSRAWAAGLARKRPLSTLPELLAGSDSAWWSLPPEDWQEAFATHPALGEQHAAATAQSLAWSQGEQSRLAVGEASLRERIAANNRAYQERFGRVFLLRAAGRSAAEILAIQQQRLHNTPEAELQESAEQQREITHLRLQRWLQEQEESTA